MKTSEHIRVIGIDCAVDARKCGIAIGEVANAEVHLDEVATGLNDDALDQWVVRSYRRPAVIALDSPLGWPRALTSSLRTHQAGQPLEVQGHALFRRATDTFVHQQTGKLPLDVGADRIARTAAATLIRLGRWRKLLNHPLPLLMSEQDRNGIVEVYPAATLKMHEMPYSRFDQLGVWQLAVERLNGVVDVMDHVSVISTSRDAFDAVVCLLAAADFIRGDCPPPTNPELALQEGWIWFRKPLE